MTYFPSQLKGYSAAVLLHLSPAQSLAECCESSQQASWLMSNTRAASTTYLNRVWRTTEVPVTTGPSGDLMLQRSLMTGD